jgi:hypothetical protein
MRTKQAGLLAAVLGLFAFLSLACGFGDKLKEQAAEEVFEQALEEAGAAGEVELDVGQEIDISDLPPWLSYPNAKATGKMTLAQDGDEGTMYVLETADPVDTVADWYKAALSTWEQSASFETGGSMQLVYTDGANQAVQLTLAAEGEQTAISCWYAKTEAEVKEEAPRQPPASIRPGPRKMGPGNKGIKGRKVTR